jgi:hypothetical protein
MHDQYFYEPIVWPNQSKLVKLSLSNKNQGRASFVWQIWNSICSFCVAMHVHGRLRKEEQLVLCYQAKYT